MSTSPTATPVFAARTATGHAAAISSLCHTMAEWHVTQCHSLADNTLNISMRNCHTDYKNSLRVSNNQDQTCSTRVQT